MYLFPTKALAEDQLHEFQAAIDAMGSEIRAFTYDGDTPQDARKAIRQRANVVLTNPDMLHSRHPAAPHALGQAVSRTCATS
jgi:DEAD/DEAH box helicase domain-containing protein